MSEWWQELTGLVLPADCAGCGRRGTALCARCRGALAGRPRRVRPAPRLPGLPPVHAAAPYGGAVRAVLLAHKERGAIGLSGELGGALADVVREACAGGARPVLLVPVPSARRSVAARGHDPIRRMARAAAARLRSAGVDARTLPVLRQRRVVADQAGLTAGQRRGNVAGALEAVPGSGRLLTAGDVVLVDDLVTTGSSLAEAARALHAAGRRPGGCAGGGAGYPVRTVAAAVIAAPAYAFQQAPQRPEEVRCST